MAKMMEKVPTPLEGVDAALDIVNQVVRTPFRVVRNVATAIGDTAGKLERDIASPSESSEIPPTPDQIIKPGINGVSHIIGGVTDMARGAVDGLVETGRGVQQELQSFIR